VPYDEPVLRRETYPFHFGVPSFLHRSLASPKGIKIFTSDPRQLRENVARSGDRELALDLRQRTSERHHLARWRFVRGIVRGRRLAADLWRRFKKIFSRRTVPTTQREAIP
jgi:hypothetical protein